MKAPHQKPASPAARLAREPYRFDFFQAVRLLMLRACRPAATAQAQREIGHDYQPDAELVRFRAHVSHAFPAGEIVDFRAEPAAPPADVPRTPPRMTVAFLGLIGPLGALPRHYTQLVIDRVRARDFALRDFLDLFHHRIVSLFYRAWAKYHFPVLYETAAVSTQRRDSDIFTRGLYGLIGFGTGGLRDRLSVHDETLLYYAGLLAHFPRNAVSLERLLDELFRTPTEVLQFQGQWLQLDDADQSRLTTPHFGRGWNNVLGQTALVGECVWSVESKFRIRLGPLSLPQFLSFSPLGARLPELVQLVRTYVGPDLDFDVQPVLRRAEVPACRLGDRTAARLGWTTWVRSQDARCDARDAVFAPEGDLVCN